MNPSRLRSLVFARDGGHCSVCHADTESIRLGYEAALAAARERHAAVMRDTAIIGYRVTLSAERLRREIRDIKERLEALGFRPGQALWQMHHSTALAEGGRNTLDNLETRCMSRLTKCHDSATQETRARLRRKPVKHLLELRECRDGKVEWR